MRKLIMTALAAIVAVLSLSSIASANVAVENGVGHVDKGDVQSALKWNNGDFDKGVGSLKFTGSYKATYDNTLTCRSGQVTHVPVVGTGTGDINATVTKSSNGKQITGWNLTGGTATGAANDTSQIVAQFWTACSDGSVPVGVSVASTPTITFDGLKVNGVDLPNTPVVVPVA